MTLPLIVALFACGSPTATTATTEAAEPDRPVLVDFDNPEACAPCHATVVAEWQESMHARAHHDNDPIYGHMKALRMKKQGEQIAGKCQQCHNPRAPAEPDSPAGRQGVSCATCHAATEVHRDRGPGAKALVFSDDTLRSARDVAEHGERLGHGLVDVLLRVRLGGGQEDRDLFETCVGGARNFGDLDDPESEVSRMLRENEVSVLRPEMHTNPNVYYIGLDAVRASVHDDFDDRFHRYLDRRGGVYAAG